MSSATILLLIGLCVLLQGFFSGSEIALVSANRLRLHTDAESGRRGAGMALAMLARPTRTLGTCLIGTNLSVIASATLAAALVARSPELPEALAAIGVIPLTLTFGEMVPKAVYQHHADRVVPVVVYPLRLAAWLFAPALMLLELFERLLGVDASEQRPVTREEIRLLMGSDQTSDLTPADQEMIRRVFEFTEADVETAMVPLIQVVALPENASCADAARRMTESGHSRLPVYQDRIDRITGVVVHQDLLAQSDWSAPVTSVLRPPLFVPETKPVDQLLLEMRRQRQRLAVAVDEYGGAVGLITAEDLLEEIVGDIQDESDRSVSLVRRVGEREWIAVGRAEREHLQKACGLVLPDGDFETVAGFLLMRLGRVPKRGERTQCDGFELTVHNASDRAVLEVQVRRLR